MKTIIAYASKTGTTEKCAKMLADRLGDVVLVNLEKETPNISKYDLIIIGGSIRIGTLHKAAKRFIEVNKENLKTKKTAYFICNGTVEQTNEFFTKNISKDLLDTSVYYTTFGGEMILENQRGIDKFIVKMVSKSKDAKEPKILVDNINEFAKKVLEYFIRG